MYGYRCLRCNMYWSCQAAPGQGFDAITKWCPYCLAHMFPVADPEDFAEQTELAACSGILANEMS